MNAVTPEIIAAIAFASLLLGFGLGYALRKKLSEPDPVPWEIQLAEKQLDVARTELARVEKAGGLAAPQISPIEAYVLGQRKAESDRIRKCQFPDCNREHPQSEMQSIQTADGLRLMCPKCAAFVS